MEKKLLEACDKGDFKTALQLISQGADPKLARDGWGWTPLHWACREGNLSFIKTLVEKHSCDVECKTSTSGSTPLHVACRSGHLEVVKYLTIEQHCDLQCTSKDGQTPLHMVCRYGHLEVVKYLTSEQHCDLACRDKSGETPLHLACLLGKLAVVKYLTSEQYCNLESSDQEGHTPLYLACRRRHFEVAWYLIRDKHCSVKLGLSDAQGLLEWANGKGVLQHLTSEHHGGIILEKGDAEALLLWACAEGILQHLTTSELIIREKGDAEALVLWASREGILQQLTTSELTILEKGDAEALLLLASQKGYLAMVKYLVREHHCNLESSDQEGHTPLHLACRMRHFEVACYLIRDKHCSVKLGQSDAQALLEWANRKGVLQHLMSEHHGGIILEKGDAEALLLWASQRGNLEVVKYLTSEQQCNLMSSDHWGRTPLHLACQEGHLAVVKYLVSEHHCNLESSDQKGHTPLYLACQQRHFEVAWHLIRDKHCSVKLGQSDAQGLLEWANRRGVLQQLTSEHHGGIILEKGVAEALLLWASRYGHLEVVKYLTSEHHCNLESSDHNGHTPLYLACLYGHAEIVHYLLSERSCNANYTTEDGCTPLSVTEDSRIIRDLLRHGANPENVYVQYGSHLPKHCPKQPQEASVKTFTVGDPGAGKTTLVKALEKEGKGLSRITNRLVKVSRIDQNTAGIIPHRVESRTFGNIMFYDFAGHKEFYASHAAMIRQSMAGSSAAIFLVLADLRSSDEDFKGSILSWLSFIDNQCPSVDLKPHIIIVGSHADETKSKAEIANKSAIVNSLVPTAVFTNLHFTGYVTINCCYSESTSISELRRHLARSCEDLRIKSQLNFNTHCFLLYLLDKFQDVEAVKLEEVLTKVSESSTQAATELGSNTLLSFIPTKFPDKLYKMCADLHERGSILLLRNAEKPKESWVILDQAVLLSQVTGTVFAPEGFKQHRDLASSTGVVPFSKLQAHFPNLDPDMVAQFLCHLEFCQEVSDHEVLQLLQTNDTPLLIEERIFFFPALVSLDAPGMKPVAITQLSAQIAPSKVWKPNDDFVYHNGWILQCSESEHFFTPRFLQVLILRLAFSFALIPDTQDIKEDLPAIQRECDVWKSGICWHNRSGVGALVEVGQSKTVNVLLRCLKGREMECIHLRSAIIRKALCAREEFCPKVSASEYFIHPTDAIEYPLKSTSDFNRFSIAKITSAITAAEPCVIGKDRLPLDLEKLLYFDPYIHLSVTVLQKLFDEQQSSCDEEVTDEFMHQMAQCAHTKLEHFVKMFSMFKPPIHNVIEQATPSSTHAIVQLFHLWRLRSRKNSYRCLRRELDQFSVFAGRNPLDPISSALPTDVAPTVVDPATDDHSSILQSVDETALGITSLLEVRAELKEATPFWMDLGLALGLLQYTLESIKLQNLKDVGQCLTETLAAWLQGRDGVAAPSWRAIVEALLSPAINFHRLAVQIAESDTHQGRSSNSSSNTSLQDVNDAHLDDSSLHDVKSALVTGGRDLSWFHLGLTLGLYYGTLKVIQRRCSDDEECLRETLTAWLRRQDRVRQQGLPSWKSLTRALAHPLVNQQGLAEEITRKHPKEVAIQASAPDTTEH